MKREGKVSCVKTVAWFVVFVEGANTLLFYIFEYGGEYGAECSAESGAEYYFISEMESASVKVFSKKERARAIFW